MKREIKFRAKNIDNNKWVCGSFVLDAKGGCRIATVDSSGKGLNFHYVIPKTVGQFTGLLDKNGREIYEGDILTIDSISANTHVVFIDGCFWLSYDEKDNEQILPLYSETKFNVWKVIGNIHENQKMLNSK